jgi:hypothetical protein
MGRLLNTGKQGLQGAYAPDGPLAALIEQFRTGEV